MGVVDARIDDAHQDAPAPGAHAPGALGPDVGPGSPPRLSRVVQGVHLGVSGVVGEPVDPNEEYIELYNPAEVPAGVTYTLLPPVWIPDPGPAYPDVVVSLPWCLPPAPAVPLLVISFLHMGGQALFGVGPAYPFSADPQGPGYAPCGDPGQLIALVPSGDVAWPGGATISVAPSSPSARAKTRPAEAARPGQSNGRRTAQLAWASRR